MSGVAFRILPRYTSRNPTCCSRGIFKGPPICHHKRFEKYRNSYSIPLVARIWSYLGPEKSVTDMVYGFVEKGTIVSWIIRNFGEGPTLLFSTPDGGRYESSTEKGAMAFSPSSLMPTLWLARLIQGTNMGRDYRTCMSQEGDQGCRDTTAYRDTKIALPCLKDLVTNTS